MLDNIQVDLIAERMPEFKRTKDPPSTVAATLPPQFSTTPPTTASPIVDDPHTETTALIQQLIFSIGY